MYSAEHEVHTKAAYTPSVLGKVKLLCSLFVQSGVKCTSNQMAAWCAFLVLCSISAENMPCEQQYITNYDCYISQVQVDQV